MQGGGLVIQIPENRKPCGNMGMTSSFQESERSAEVVLWYSTSSVPPAPTGSLHVTRTSKHSGLAFT